MGHTMNIKMDLDPSFVRFYNKMKRKYGKDFAEMQGLSNSNLNFTTFIDNFVDSENVAKISIDANSNIDQKDVINLMAEMSKPHKKLLAFNKIFYELKKKYNKKIAKKVCEELWNYGIYLHDFDTSTYIPYCFAYDFSSIAEKGLYFIEGYNAEPPKHLDSFIQIIMEAIAFLSRRQSGAVGLPNIIPYLYYFWKKDIEENPVLNQTGYKEQQLQAFIYRLNQPWLRQDQCAFTNVSIFDHPYFEAIFGGSTFPDGSLMIDYEEEIIEFQKDFIKVVNEVREKNIFTFPVLTASLLYQDNKFVDEEFAMWACEASRKWNIFNFFTDSSVNSLSNCCRLKSDISDLYFNSIGGTALKVGSVKVATLNIARLSYKAKDKEDFFKLLREETQTALVILDIIRNIIQRNVEKGLLPNFSCGLIDFKSLYQTVGINGIFEAISTFDMCYTDEITGNMKYTDEAYELGKEIFQEINQVIDDFSQDKDYKINKEQVPKKSGDILE